MNIVAKIIEKLKLKELFGMLFISSMIITFLPIDILKYLNVYDFKIKYQTYISVIIIIIGSYYLINICKFILSELSQIIFSDKRIAIKYLKKGISMDEMSLLIQTYYDPANKIFRTSGTINMSDGRKAALENRHIIYLASTVSTRFNFSYNLQPYAADLLNKNLKRGNIEITANEIKYRIK